MSEDDIDDVSSDEETGCLINRLINTVRRGGLNKIQTARDNNDNDNLY